MTSFRSTAFVYSLVCKNILLVDIQERAAMIISYYFNTLVNNYLFLSFSVHLPKNNKERKTSFSLGKDEEEKQGLYSELITTTSERD